MSEKSNKSPITVKEEEVDLGKLLSIIGKMFTDLFKFIGRVLKGLFGYLILLLFFFQKHFIKIVLIAIMGTVIGFIIDTKTPTEYKYDTIIRPNYKSIYQIREEVEYLNNLIDDEKYDEVAQKLDISQEKASEISEIDVLPYDNESELILSYNEIIKELDTTTLELTPYSKFIDFQSYEAVRYVCKIISTDKNTHFDIEILLEKTLKNKKLVSLRNNALNVLLAEEKAIYKDLSEIDSTRLFLRKYLLKEINKDVPNTNINLSQEKESTQSNIELFKISRGLTATLKENAITQESIRSIVNVDTNFIQKGTIIYPKLLDRKAAIIPLVLLSLLLLFIIIKELNNYLNKKKQLKF